jgi:hypothetical protein
MSDFIADGYLMLCGYSTRSTPTRLYLPGSGSAPISPAVESVWEKTSTYKFPCSRIKSNINFLELSVSEDIATTPYDVLVAQFVSPPLRAQTIAGNVFGQIQVRTSDAAADFCRAIVIKVISSTGYVRGILLSHFPATLSSEFSSTVSQNRHFPPPDTALTPVEVQDGDRIVIEIGLRSFNAVTTAYYSYFLFGDSAPNDLPDNETTEDYRNPFVEFSQSLQWLVDNAYAAAGYVQVTGESVQDSSDELTTAYAADGYVRVTGDCVMDAPEDLVTAFVADGAIYLCGDSAFNTPSLDTFRADGFVQLCGAGRMDSTVPYVDPSISLITAYAAAGGVSLYSDCRLGTGAELQSDYAAAGTLLICGGCNLGTPSEALTTAYVAGGFIMFGGSCGLIQGPVSAYAAQTKSGPCLEISGDSKATFIYPALSDYEAEGGVSLVGPGVLGGVPDEGSFETLVLTGNRSEIAFYTNFNFNSYAKYKGKSYGATEQGVFLLEGEDDDGQGIVPGARIGPANFGTDREKRLRLVRCGGKCDQARVRVLSDTGLEEIKDVVGGRANISRKVQGREITLDIAGFETLNFLQIVPLILAKR